MITLLNLPRHWSNVHSLQGQQVTIPTMPSAASGVRQSGIVSGPPSRNRHCSNDTPSACTDDISLIFHVDRNAAISVTFSRLHIAEAPPSGIQEKTKN